MIQTKRRRLVAETADDLQQILFGESEPNDGVDGDLPNSREIDAVVPVQREEPEDVEYYSGSDRDSMDEFIVRDTNEPRENRLAHNFSERYGDDVAESINDVIAVFGDLRILDIYAQGESGRVKRVVDRSEPIESRFDPEEVAAQMASSRDDLILRTDVPERTQEEQGTERSLETITVFEEGLTTDILEAEWAIEAHWIYASLREIYAQRLKGRSDWTMWTPVKPEDAEAKKHELKQDHSAVCEDQYKQDVIKRIHVLLRDMKGRAMDPLLIWNSMTRAKYWWYFNQEDMQGVKSLDGDWAKLLSKYRHIESRLSKFLALTEAFLARDQSLPLVDSLGSPVKEQSLPLVESMQAESMALVESVGSPVKTQSIGSIEIALASNLQSDINKLLVELASLMSPEGMNLDFNETLDDITGSISGEIEPVAKYLFANEGGRKLPGTSALVALIISNSLHESLIPLLTLSPQELGENLSIGAKIHKGPFSGTAAPSPPSDLPPALHAAIIEYLSSTLAGNLKVRKWFRREFRSRAVLFTHPLSAHVSATERFYSVRRLAGRPVESLFGTEVFLAISHLVSAGEISMDLATMHEGRLVVEGCEELPESVCRAVQKRVIEQDARFDESDEIEENILRNSSLIYKKSGGKSSGEKSTDLVCFDPIFADILYYVSPDVGETSTPPWMGELRLQLVKSVVAKLYKTMKAELASKLTRDSNLVCAQRAGAAFGELIRMQGFDVRRMTHSDDSENDKTNREIIRRKMGLFTAMGVVAERLLNGFRTHIAIVNHRGDLIESQSLDSILGGPDTKRDGDRARIAALMKRHLVSLIVIGADDRKARIALNEFRSIASNVYNDGDDVWNSLKGPVVEFGDTKIAARVAKLLKKKDDSDELSESVRAAISLARFNQCPIAETLMLWSDLGAESNHLLTVPVHELQAFVPKSILEKEFLRVITATVASTGVDFNDCIASRSRSNLLKFVPGLGPRKARALIEAADAHLRGIDASSSPSESRVSRIEKILGGFRVFQNAQPFIKLVPDCDKVAVFSNKADDSSDGGSSSSLSDLSDAAAAVVVYDRKYFGVSNDIVRQVLKGFDFRELCRFAKDCWPVAAALLSEWKQSKGFYRILGDSAKFANLAREVDLDAFVDSIFKSEDVPAHLTDPEIESGSIKMNARTVIEELVAKQLLEPFADALTYEWTPVTKHRLFYACMRESELELNKFTVVTCTVQEVGSKDWLKLNESNSNMEGWVQKSRGQYNTRFSVGDAVRCRISEIDFQKFSLSFSFESVSERDLQDLSKWNPYLVVLDSDVAHLHSLGKVEQAVKPVVKARRIIKHDSYFEIPHKVAVEKLALAAIGEVIFRPSTSQPGQYFGMIKFMSTAESRDASKEDWIKVFRFTEGPSARQASKTVFKLVDANEEFEEFDQMKVLYVDKYLRNLAELRAHPKFRPEHIEQVKNMIIAKIKTGTSHGSVVYSLVMDPRRECAGNALMLWASEPNKIHEDVIEINNRGFKWWTKGPYPSLNTLLNWWKQGGYKERNALIDDWRNQLTKRAP